MRISDWSSDVCSSERRRPFGTFEEFEVRPQRQSRRLPGEIVERRDTARPRIVAAHREGIGVLEPERAEQPHPVRPARPRAHELHDPRARRHIGARSEEHTSELQSLMRNSYAVFCLKKKTQYNTDTSVK